MMQSLSTEGQSVTFVYVDGTQGWVNVQDSTSAVQGAVTNMYLLQVELLACTGVMLGIIKPILIYRTRNFYVFLMPERPAGSNTVWIIS